MPSYADRELPHVTTDDSGTPATGTIDDSDVAWTWVGMTEISDPQFYGGKAHAGGPGTSGIYTFNGTGVSIAGFAGKALLVDKRPRRIGSATITIDGKVCSTVSLKSTDADFQHVMFSTSALPSGNHVLKIDAASDWIVIDFIKASTTEPAHTETDSTPGKLYRIFSKELPVRCLQTADVSLGANAAIEIGPADRNRSQVWKVVSLGNGAFRISPADAPGQALTLSRSALTDETNQGRLNPIIVGKYTGAPEQKWLLTPVDGQWYHITLPTDPAMHFNVWNHDKYVAGYHRMDSNNDDNELWNFVPVAAPAPK